MKNLFKILTIVLLLTGVSTIETKAQLDSLRFENGNTIVGEVKTLFRGVLTIETDYSDSDFKIEWKNVKEIYTKNYYLISLSDGSRYNGNVNSVGPGKIKIITDENEEHIIDHDELVWLDDLDQGFWSQLYASIDVGFDLTKANNFRQLSSRANIGYYAKRWNIDASYNTLYSTQDNTEKIERQDGGLVYKYFLPNDWYPMASINFLSTTEQKLALRATTLLGFGKYIINTNVSYWGFIAGVNNNNERFTDDSIADRNSWEGVIGSELNLYDIGDLNLLTKLNAYPSFTESGRWRADFDFNARYEMPFDDDFYIKLGVTLNYDNQPVDGASDLDYVLHTGFGWQW
jgi:hypothetical protein